MVRVMGLLPVGVHYMRMEGELQRPTHRVLMEKLPILIIIGRYEGLEGGRLHIKCPYSGVNRAVGYDCACG